MTWISALGFIVVGGVFVLGWHIARGLPKADHVVYIKTENVYEEENAGRFVNSGDPGPID